MATAPPPPAADDLEQLAAEIAALGEQIKSLKAATPGPVDQDAIGAAVASLLAAKKRYAELNNGIGVDGKPFGGDGGKSKKKKEGGGGGGPAKQVSVFLCIGCFGSIFYHHKLVLDTL